MNRQEAEKREPRRLSFFAEKEGLSELCERCFLDSLCEDRKMRHAQHAFKARLSLTKKGPFWVLFVSGEGGI